MKNRVLMLLLVTTTGALAGEAQDIIARARAAREDGVPQAAIYDLKRAAAHIGGPEAPQVVVELARCLVAADREAEAVNWCRRTIYRDDPAVIFWRAQALAQQGDYAAAFADYQRAGAADPALRAQSDLGSARMLEAQGRLSEAIATYANIPPGSDFGVTAQLASATVLIKAGRSGDARKLLEKLEPREVRDRERRSYLLGRIDLERGATDDAARRFEDSRPRDRRLAAGTAIGRADALSRGDENEKAESVLEEFIRENLRSPQLGELMAKLDEVRGRQKEPSNAALKQWENDDRNPELSGLASYYLARGDERQGRTDRAIRNYAEFVRRHPENPLRDAATVRLGRLLLATGQVEAAAKLIASAPKPADRADEAKLRFERGATEYQIRDYAAATKTFVSAANLDSAIAESSLANAALAAVDAGNDPLAAEILSALRKENAATARRIELAQAFADARAGNPEVVGALERLARGGGAIGDRARLALAEWRWQQGNLAQARREYRRVANSSAAGMGDRKDYFAIYLADDGSLKAVDPVAQAARDFLQRHPDSPRAADVRMKWGEVLMRAGDFRGARVQFEEAGNATNDPARRQSAMFLAARAAAGSMAPEEIDEAIYTLLEAVAAQKSSDSKSGSGDGASGSNDLAVEARWEQAMLQSARHRPEESVKILDSLIATNRDPRLRFAAQLKRGEALLEIGSTQPERRAAAIKEWRAVADSPDALPAERNEALTHIGAASEQAGDVDAALAAYYEALTSPRDRQPEYFWYYKSGFAAAQLLIKRERLKEAVAIYEKMAAVPGPRSDEAKEQVKHLRLENFIWED